MRRLVLGAVALLVAAAGCGGDPKADPSPTPSTPTVSTSPSPAAPTLPDAARANTRAGAVAFVRYYVELINHLQATGDEIPLAAASERTCRSCKAVISAAHAIYDAGGHVEGGSWTIDKLSASEPAAGVWTVRVRGRVAPSRVIRIDSASSTTGSGGAGNADFFVSFNNAWKVAQWHTG